VGKFVQQSLQPTVAW